MLLSSQHVVLVIENFEFTSKEIIESFDVTLDQLSVSFWSDFFKQVIAAATVSCIPAICAMAHSIFDPTSKFGREFTSNHAFGHVKVFIH